VGLEQFDVAKQAPCLEKDAARTFDQQPPCRRHGNAARRPVEQLHAQFFLQRLNAAAKRGLTQMHAFSGARKAALFGERNQVGEPA
jgi:hypothetical protein